MDQKRLKELLKYDPVTGVFKWVVKGRGISKTVAGGVNRHPTQGYVSIGLDGGKFRAHRLAFLYMTGAIPDEVDHINCKRADNRWENLRAATRSGNNMNSAPRVDNTSGVKGVSWDAPNKRWKTYINVKGRQVWLGGYADKETAVAVRHHAAERYYGEYARI